MSWIAEQLDAMIDLGGALREDPQYVASLDRTCQMVVDCLERGGKVLTVGNGGSATDALHLAEELIGRFRTNRRPLPAICLAADTSALTCIANDFGFDYVFSRQVEALCAPGDVLIAFTTSGNSANIMLALQAAKDKGGRTVGMLGRGGGRSLPLCDEAFVVPHQNTARIQEMHTLALHVICEAVERKFGLGD